MRTARSLPYGGLPDRDPTPRQRPPWTEIPVPGQSPPVNRMTHRCKTLPCPKLRLRAVRKVGTVSGLDAEQGRVYSHEGARARCNCDCLASTERWALWASVFMIIGPDNEWGVKVTHYRKNLVSSLHRTQIITMVSIILLNAFPKELIININSN